jgi:Flp pilus assembly protein TadB
MKVRNTMYVCSILLAVSLLCLGMLPARAQNSARTQDNEHAVSSNQLRNDLQKAAENRQANEAAVREMFATDAGKQALKSAGIEYQKVDQAISQVDDGELARLADRSREVKKDFVAGRMSDRDLLIIVLIAVILIVVILAVR